MTPDIKNIILLTAMLNPGADQMTTVSDNDGAQAQKILRARYETNTRPEDILTDISKKEGERTPCMTRQDPQSGVQLARMARFRANSPPHP
jgi:hypothetical protein